MLKALLGLLLVVIGVVANISVWVGVVLFVLALIGVTVPVSALGAAAIAIIAIFVSFATSIIGGVLLVDAASDF